MRPWFTDRAATGTFKIAYILFQATSLQLILEQTSQVDVSTPK